MKRTKQDKQFWIQVDQSNRDFLTNISMFMLAFSVSLISLIISVLALIISIQGINVYTIIISIIFSLGVIFTAFYFSKKVKKINKNSRNLNEQLQEELFELYPEYKNKYH